MIEMLLSAPVILKILMSLAAIIILNKLISSQILGVLAGILILSFWSGHSPADSVSIAWMRFSNIDNVFLLVVVFMIIILSVQMKESGIMDSLVINITNRFSKTKSMAILPAVIGLLPMPGGAVFSAPLVESCDPENQLDPDLKTRINYWFRHIWEYFWPLYPGVLLAIEITGLPVPVFMLFMFPVTIFSVAGAWFFLLRKANFSTNSGKESLHRGSALEFLFLVSPIIIIIAVYIVTGLLLPGVSEVSRYIPILIGIIFSIIYLQIIRPLGGGVWKKILGSRRGVNMVILVALIRIYGAFIEGRLPDGSLLMEVLRSELSAAGISTYLLIMLIPLVCGISTGIAIGTVGAAFPIIISLIGPDPSFSLLMSTTVLAYSIGHVGQLLSPVHVCLLVSNEYFSVKLGKSLLGILKPAIVVAAAGFLLSRLYLLIL